MEVPGRDHHDPEVPAGLLQVSSPLQTEAALGRLFYVYLNSPKPVDSRRRLGVSRCRGMGIAPLMGALEKVPAPPPSAILSAISANPLIIAKAALWSLSAYVPVMLIMLPWSVSVNVIIPSGGLSDFSAASSFLIFAALRAAAALNWITFGTLLFLVCERGQEGSYGLPFPSIFLQIVSRQLSLRYQPH